jgi:putative redox protein
MATQRFRVSCGEGERVLIDVRGHELTTDQPVDAGGSDAGPTPTELFVASLASCMAFYAQRFLRRNEVPAAGLRIDVRFGTTSDRPYRVSKIEMDVTLPPQMARSLQPALERVMDRCTVHNTLRDRLSIAVTVR